MAQHTPSPLPVQHLLRAVRSVLLPDEAPADALPPLSTLEDRQSLARLAQIHAVTPLVLAGLRRSSAPPLPAVVRALQPLVIRQGLWSMALRSELCRLAGLLDAAGLPFVVLKGVAVHDAYGALSLRPSVDNDILVRPEDFGTLERLLVEAGYGREHRSPRRKQTYLFVHGQYTFRRQHGEHRLSVDAHTRVMPFGYRYSENVGALRTRGRTLSVNGVDVAVPSWEDLIVILCTNGLKDLWQRLRLVADLVAVSGQVSDWDAVAALAERSNCRAQVSLGLTLVEDVFERPLPAPFASPDAPVRRLARLLSDQLRGAPADARVADRVRLFLSAQDDTRSRLRYVLYTALRRASEPLTGGGGPLSTSLD